MGKARRAGRADGDAGTTEQATGAEAAPETTAPAGVERGRGGARRAKAPAKASSRPAAGQRSPADSAALAAETPHSTAAPAPAESPRAAPAVGAPGPTSGTAVGLADHASTVDDPPALTALEAPVGDSVRPDAAPTAAASSEALTVQGLQAQLDALERRLERGLRFVHVVADRNQRAIGGHAALLHGLGDALTRAQVLVPAEVAAARDGYLAAAPAPEFRIRVAADVDKYAVPAVEIDCEARLALCKAACCRRPFALSTQDLEEGVLRWDFADPYVNRRDADGRCVHATDACRCGVYAQRPVRCRRFDCRQDASIWIDFDRQIPNPELASLPTPRPAAATREAAAGQDSRPKEG